MMSSSVCVMDGAGCSDYRSIRHAALNGNCPESQTSKRKARQHVTPNKTQRHTQPCRHHSKNALPLRLNTLSQSAAQPQRDGRPTAKQLRHPHFCIWMVASVLLLPSWQLGALYKPCCVTTVCSTSGYIQSAALLYSVGSYLRRQSGQNRLRGWPFTCFSCHMRLHPFLWQVCWSFWRVPREAQLRQRRDCR